MLIVKEGSLMEKFRFWRLCLLDNLQYYFGYSCQVHYVRYNVFDAADILRIWTRIYLNQGKRYRKKGQFIFRKIN